MNSQSKAIFTFARQVTCELGPEGIAWLSEVLGVSCQDEVKQLCPAGTRSLETEETYRVLDLLLLPHVQLAVFYDNFSSPELIFGECDELLVDASGEDLRLLDAKVTYFAFWESGAGADSGSLEVAIEAKIRLPIVAGVNLESPYENSDPDIQEQLLECKNMFNIFFDNCECDDDEVLVNTWSARLE